MSEKKLTNPQLAIWAMEMNQNCPVEPAKLWEFIFQHRLHYHLNSFDHIKKKFFKADASDKFTPKETFTSEIYTDKNKKKEPCFEMIPETDPQQYHLKEGYKKTKRYKGLEKYKESEKYKEVEACIQQDILENGSEAQGVEHSSKHKNQPEKILLEEEIKEKVNEESYLKENWQIQLKQRLLKMSPKKFEEFCRLLVQKMGVEIDENKDILATRDSGIDGYGYMTSNDVRTSRVAIQAKRWNNEQRISTPEIDKFIGAMINNNAEFGIFITTVSFTHDAEQCADESKYPITLINGDKIIELVEKYQLYIQPVITYQLDKFYFEEN